MDDPVQLTSFSHLERYEELLDQLLTSDLQGIPNKQQEQEETRVLWALCGLLDEYQEQSYLLDPVLEQLVSPLILALRALLQRPQVDWALPRVQRVARLIYVISKVRGAKSIVRFFPHEVTDLSALLRLLEPPELLQDATWYLRYILLLWLSVACRVPFDLAHLPGADQAISSISYRFLSEASKERDGAVALLSRYHSRQGARLDGFLAKCQQAFSEPSTSSTLTSGLLEALSQILKSASPTSLHACWPTLYHLLALCAGDSVGNGAVVSKFRVKLAGRLALLRLAERKGDVPEEVEVVLQEMMESLSDKDTIVRWSAAKYIARISECLPEEMAHQVSEAILDTFETNFEEIEMAENSLQGACFAFGELARRGRIQEELVDRLVACALQALLYDRKRGVQSIGSGVRDSAAYVLWSLARTLRPAQISPAASLGLATTLVSVALFDKDIHIRRAASAAFQESVGRWSIFPHGIDVLRTIDFFTISVRKRAYLEAAPMVAEHIEYRRSLVQHLLDVGLIHYDPDVRSLAAQSLERIVRLDPRALGPELVDRQIPLLAAKDTARLHGTLLSLAALAESVADLEDSFRLPLTSKIFLAVASLPPTLRALRTSPLVLSAALQALGSSCTTESALAARDQWHAILKLAGDKSDEEVHSQAASAMRRISSHIDCSDEVTSTLIADLASRIAARQQCSAVILGQLDYSTHTRSQLDTVMQRLVSFVGHEAPLAASTVEARRNGIYSLATLICSTSAALPAETLSAALAAMLRGFSDYTTDQRGDVGSWIRVACIEGVQLVLPHLARHSPQSLEQDVLDQAISALLKQGVERLDNVREKAGEALRSLVDCEELRSRDGAHLRGLELFEDIRVEREQWRDVAWASERLLPLLAVEEYRSMLLEGAVLAATRHSSSSPLLDYAASLPPSAPAESASGMTEYTLFDLVKDVTSLAKRNHSVNRLFIPALTLLGSLMDADCFEGASDAEGGEETLREVLLVSTRGLGQIKSAPRLTATVKVVVHLFGSSAPTSSLGELAADRTLSLLTHTAPWLRQQTAEELQGSLILGAGDDEESELEAILLETSWSELTNAEELRTKASRVIELWSQRD